MLNKEKKNWTKKYHKIIQGYRNYGRYPIADSEYHQASKY